MYEAVENVDVDNWVQKYDKNIKRPKSAAKKIKNILIILIT